MGYVKLGDLLLTAIQYEHWLRYYFAQPLDAVSDEEGQPTSGQATLIIPEAWQMKARAEMPQFAPLMEELLTLPVSMENARTAVFNHVAACIQANPTDPAFGQQLMELLEKPDFRRDLDAFHAWVQEQAETEIQTSALPEPQPFTAWIHMFKTWVHDHYIPHVTTISQYKEQEPK